MSRNTNKKWETKTPHLLMIQVTIFLFSYRWHLGSIFQLRVKIRWSYSLYSQKYIRVPKTNQRRVKKATATQFRMPILGAGMQRWVKGVGLRGLRNYLITVWSYNIVYFLFFIPRYYLFYSLLLPPMKLTKGIKFEEDPEYKKVEDERISTCVAI